jgi:hypothetical protein
MGNAISQLEEPLRASTAGAEPTDMEANPTAAPSAPPPSASMLEVAVLSHTRDLEEIAVQVVQEL